MEAAFARAVILSLERTPRPVADKLGAIYANVLDALIPRLRRTAERNLSFAYPDCDAAWRARTIDQVYRSIGRLLVAFARFPGIDAANVHEWIYYEGLEHYQRAKQRGKGVLFATAHLGNWELSAFAHALLTEPMNVVVQASRQSTDRRSGGNPARVIGQYPDLEARFRPIDPAGFASQRARRDTGRSECFAGQRRLLFLSSGNPLAPALRSRNWRRTAGRR